MNTKTKKSNVWVCPRCNEVYDLRKIDPSELEREDCPTCRKEAAETRALAMLTLHPPPEMIL